MLLPHDEAGEGPVLVLLHAGIADRTMWSGHLDPLAGAGFRAIAPDLPGFGEAPQAPRAEPWADVLETLAALGVERAALAGNSFGGYVALAVAVIAPELVDRLALVSALPPDLDPSERLLAAWAAEEEAIERGDVDAAVAAVLDAWLLPGAPAELRDAVATMQRRAFAQQLGADAPADAPDPLEDDPDAIERLALPVLAAAGEHDMPDFAEGAERLARRIPGARHAVIAGAGHLAPLERPDAFRELLLGFLAVA